MVFHLAPLGMVPVVLGIRPVALGTCARAHEVWAVHKDVVVITGFAFAAGHWNGLEVWWLGVLEALCLGGL